MWVVDVQHKSTVTQNKNAHDTERHYLSCLLPSTSATTTTTTATTLSSAPSYPITNTQLPLKSTKSPQFNYRRCHLTSTNKHASNNKQFPSHSHKVNPLPSLSSAMSSTSLNTISTTVSSTPLSVSTPTLLIADINDVTSTMIYDRHHLNTQQTMNKLTTDDINVQRANWSIALSTTWKRLKTSLSTHIQNFRKLKNINPKPERYII